MNVLYFGRYQKHYSRNEVMINGLKQNNVKIIEAHSSGLFWPIDLFWKGIKAKNFDLIFVGYPGHLELFLGKLIGLFHGKPVVLDKIYSIYDTFVLDRALYPKNSIQSFLLRFVDRLDCLLADLVLLDTNAQIDFFKREFGFNDNVMQKFRRVFVGAKENNLKPKRKERKFTALFFGTFIPLQGVDYIIKAAKLVDEKINIKIIGAGQTLSESKKLAADQGSKNIVFIEPKPITYIKQQARNCDVCLGIFGKTGKAKRVIPNKAFEALAAKKPLITANTPAIRELLVPGKDFIACESADEKSLARKLLFTKNNPLKAKKIAENGFLVYKKKCCPKQIGRIVKKEFRELLA